MRVRLKIIAKLLLITVFSILLALGGFAYLNTRETIDEYKEGFEEKVFFEAQRLDGLINNVISLGVPFGQLRGMEKECRAAVAGLKYAQYCFIMGLDGKVYYHNLPEKMGVVYTDSRTQNSLKAEKKLMQFYADDLGKRFFDFALPLFDSAKDEKIGVIRIVVSAEILDKETVRLIRRALVLGILSIITACIIILLLFKFAILKPIRRLINGVVMFGKGDLDTRIELKTNDEFASIADAFNNMADNLKKSTVSIKILRQSEKRFEDIAQNTGECIWEVDTQGRYTYISPVVEKTLGYQPQEVIGKYFHDFFRPGEKEELKKAVFELFSKKEKFKDFLNRNIRKDGQTVILETSAVPIIDGNGILLGYRGIGRDITERKNKEEELKKAYEQLKLTQVQLVQSAKMSSLGVLAGGVAHEINNPLTGVLNNVQLIGIMAESKKDFNLADFKELLIVIEESALRCVKIVKSLLGFSHVSDETKQDTFLNEIIKNVVGLIEHEMKLQNICIEQQLSPNLPLITLDSQLIQQVILDIISNAKWAIVNSQNKSQGVITIKTEYNSKNKLIFIYIKDTGVGIAKENLEKIFEPFFTTKEVGEGTGLGLSIVYKIIKQHNGNIEVESEVNKGTIFKITLPVA